MMKSDPQPAADENPQKQDSDDGSFFMRKKRWAELTRTQYPRFVSREGWTGFSVIVTRTQKPRFCVTLNSKSATRLRPAPQSESAACVSMPVRETLKAAMETIGEP